MFGKILFKMVKAYKNLHPFIQINFVILAGVASIYLLAENSFYLLGQDLP